MTTDDAEVAPGRKAPNGKRVPVKASLARRREAFAWEQSTKGHSLRWIADKMEQADLGRVSFQAVSKMLQRVEAEVLKELVKRAAGMKAHQTSCLQLLLCEAIKAWEKSKEPERRVTQALDREGGGASGTATVINRHGDARLLAEARGILSDIRKIWGLDSPTKIAPTNVEGDKSYEINLDGMSVEQLKLLRQAMGQGDESGNDDSTDEPPASN